MFEVGFSKVRTYRRCPRAYFYAYVRNLQAKRRPAPMFRGTILHKMLEAWEKENRTKAGRRAALQILDQYGEKYAALFEEEREFYGENFVPDIERIFRGYLREYKDDQWDIEGIEEEIRTPLAKGVEFVGHLDLRIYTAADKRRWLVDRKTMKTIPDANERFYNYQLLLYTWAWNRESSKADAVDGVVWDYLRTKAPTVPEVLKKGGLTQRADLDTDLYTYEQALEENNIDPAPYGEYLQTLANRSCGKFYQRISLPNPPGEMVATIVEEFRQTAVVMQHLKVYPRNMTFQCPSSCEFFNLCRAELAGTNVKFVEKSEYETREEESAEAEL